jgi:hypothetical protein
MEMYRASVMIPMFVASLGFLVWLLFCETNFSQLSINLPIMNEAKEIIATGLNAPPPFDILSGEAIKFR